MTDLRAGLHTMRAHDLIHRDLKPSNLLLKNVANQPSRPQLKIADLGFCRPLAPNSLADTLCGTPLSMAPEVLAGEEYDATSDLWSVGTILFEMLTLKPPFTGANSIELLRSIERGRGAELPASLPVSEACRQLLAQLLRRSPKERIGFDAFFSHGWFSEALAETEEPRPQLAPRLQQLLSVPVPSAAPPPAEDFLLVASPPREAMAEMERGLGAMSLITSQARQARSFISRKLQLSFDGGGGSLFRSRLLQPSPQLSELHSPPRSSAAAAAAAPPHQQHPVSPAAAARLQLCAGILDLLADERVTSALRCPAPSDCARLQAEALSLLMLAVSCVRAASAAVAGMRDSGGLDADRLARGGEAIRGRARALGHQLLATSGGGADAAQRVRIPCVWPLVQAEAVGMARRAGEAGEGPEAVAPLRRALALLFLLTSDAALLPVSCTAPPLALGGSMRTLMVELAQMLGARLARARAESSLGISAC